MRKPNILFIQVDQMSANALSAYGNEVVITPTLDRLAREGAVWDTAYCNYPLCAPSRASMATGRLASKVGAYDNAAELGAEHPTYAHYLRRAGYHTALSGKMHFIGPDQHHGFQERLTPDLYPADFAWVPNWEETQERDTNDARAITVAGVCARSTQIDFDEAVTEAARLFLFDHARKGGEQPFFLQVSYTHPHEPYLCLREYWDLYEGKDIPGPRVPALSPDAQDAHSRRVLEDFGMLEHEFAPEEIARARRAHYGAISWLDDQIRRVLDVLESTGEAENTIIVFTADHGDFLGERGMWFKKHFHEPSIAVPLIIKGPGIAPQRVTTPASLVDLLPTFCGLAGAEATPPKQEPLDGEDLRAFLKGGERAEEETRILAAEYTAEATTAPILMIRRGAWKYIWCETDPALLYNLDDDPDELRNLAGQAEHAKTEQALQEEIRARWDPERLDREIRASQQRRDVIRQAHQHGTPPRWNHGEREGEPVRWYRGEGGYNAWAFDYLAES